MDAPAPARRATNPSRRSHLIHSGLSAAAVPCFQADSRSPRGLACLLHRRQRLRRVRTRNSTSRVRSEFVFNPNSSSACCCHRFQSLRDLFLQRLLSACLSTTAAAAPVHNNPQCTASHNPLHLPPQSSTHPLSYNSLFSPHTHPPLPPRTFTDRRRLLSTCSAVFCVRRRGRRIPRMRRRCCKSSSFASRPPGLRS